MKQVLFLILSLALTFLAHAQKGLPGIDEISFDLKYCGGAIYKHTKKVYLDPPSYSSEIELSISHRTYGKRKWERENNCPVPSINFCFSQYGDDLGNAFSFYPGIEWAILRKAKLNWTFKVGGGIGIASDSWIREDTLNNYLGSKLNNFTSIQTAVNYPIHKNLELQVGGRMSHMSNGAFRTPNFGINLFSGYLGVNYYPQAQKKRIVSKPVKKEKRSYTIGLRSGFALNEQGTPNGALHPIYSQSVFLGTTLLKKHRIFIGTDINYNTKALSAFQYSLINDNLDWSATNSSVFAGAELLYGRVGLPFQIGVYTKKIRNQDAVWYQKFGFQYYIYKNDKTWLRRFFVGSLLKSNKINADYIEFCAGVMF